MVGGWMDIAWFGGYLPDRNDRIVHRGLTSLTIKAKKIAGRVAVVVAKSSWRSPGSEK